MSDTRIFKSRRNHVWREKNIIYKQILPQPGETGESCGPYRRAAFESDMLRHLHDCGVYVPKFISCKNDLLSMEYIESETLADFIESAETGKALASSAIVVEKLVCWFEIFYAAVSRDCIRGDVNCRNFLVAQNGNIAGVDFETACAGRRETDCGKMIAFILTYNPQYTNYKKHLTDTLYQKFITRFNFDPDLILYAMNCELHDMIARRP